MTTKGAEARSIAWGVGVTSITGVLIVIGSRRLAHFDAALVGYTFAVLFAIFAITYRYSMWLQRPSTLMYWRRGWRFFLRRRNPARTLRQWIVYVWGDIITNGFIRHRDRMRWIAHMLLMWGCFIAFAITIPLVFGWLHFTTDPDNHSYYVINVFGIALTSFPTGSLGGFMIFHGLVWSSFLVIGGVVIAMRRRLRDHGAAALQMFGEDFLPLILLFAVSVTGLMMTASYSWMKGYAYDFLAILHAVTVIITFLWLPFGKFFHVFQRPAQIGVRFYREEGPRRGMANCARCGDSFASSIHADDLIKVVKDVGYQYELNDAGIDHYGRICPRCRRLMLGLAQGAIWAGARRDPLELTDYNGDTTD